jgi:hypothetical protein
MYKVIQIREYERGLLFRKEIFKGFLLPGEYKRWDLFNNEKVEIVDIRKPFLTENHLDSVLKNSDIGKEINVVQIADHERGLVWFDGRFNSILAPGQYGIWTNWKKVRTEIVDAKAIRFVHAEIEPILAASGSNSLLDIHDITAEHQGVLFINGKYVETLSPGRYAFWENRANVKVVTVNRKEQVLDVQGQDLLTADRVTLRLSVAVVYRVVDSVRYVTVAEDARQALYRDVQLALRSAVGARQLDVFLADKTALTNELTEIVKAKAIGMGMEVSLAGVKDVILPGEMKELMNKVIEARTAAEAAVITRREEAAALRHQANTAKMFTETPGLLKLRELEAIERIATAGKLSIVLGEKGLADRMTNLI